MDCMNRLIQVNLSTALLHQKTFLPFKGCHTGREIVVVATGPTLNKYVPLDNVINIGVNAAFLRAEIIFDYLFAMDYYSVKPFISQMNEYRKGKCVKFYGLDCEHVPQDKWQCVIPESDAIIAGALRYRADAAPIEGMKMQFAYDLSSMPLGDCYSTVFSAMQFALWTNPKRVYLVGCDTADTGHFNSGKKVEEMRKDRPIVSNPYQKILESWHLFKLFTQRYYPETEIVSVNPVGLKGLFTDFYQA